MSRTPKERARGVASRTPARRKATLTSMSPDGERKKPGSTHRSASGRRRWPGPIRDRSSGLARFRGPGPPHARGTGACLPAPSRLDPPRGPPAAGATATAVTRGGSQGTGNDNHQLGLGHLRDNPERSRGTTEDQAKRARAPKGKHAARQWDGPTPPRGRRAAHHTRTAKKRAEKVRRVRRPRAPPATSRQKAGERGRAGFRTPPLPRTTTGV